LHHKSSGRVCDLHNDTTNLCAKRVQDVLALLLNQRAVAKCGVARGVSHTRFSVADGVSDATEVSLFSAQKQPQ
jgi:hypothetical protein